MAISVQLRSDKPWCWEGNVVCAIVKHLASRGWTIDSVADTATSESGADIQASRLGEILIVEVKGYPSTTYERGMKMGQPKRTNPRTQARHWIAEALFTALLRQAETDAHRIAIALPDFQVYTNLLGRISPSLSKLGLMVMIVGESGSVTVLQAGQSKSVTT